MQEQKHFQVAQFENKQTKKKIDLEIMIDIGGPRNVMSYLFPQKNLPTYG